MSQITSERFDAYMTRAFGALFDDVRRVAVGVSGGADSMALLWCLQRWDIGRGVYVHVLSVDHGLREAADHLDIGKIDLRHGAPPVPVDVMPASGLHDEPSANSRSDHRRHTENPAFPVGLARSTPISGPAGEIP